MEKAKILIADDENQTREFVAKCIKRFIKCEIYEAADSNGAIAQMSANDFDLVILDLKLSEQNGLDVMRIVKAKKNLPKIMVVTGYDSILVATAALREGAVDYLPKPFTMELLMLRVRNILKDKNIYLMEP